MSTQTSDAPIPGTEQDDANLRVNRRRLLLTSSAVAAAPAIGSQIVQPAAAQTPPQRFAYPTDRETKNAARALALESLLIEKGIITGNTVNTVLSFFETQMGPFNGAKVVARAWVDPAFKQLLADDTPAAIAKLDLPKVMAGAEGEHMRAAVNTPTVHNLIICTLVLLLSVAGAGPAALLVQGPDLPGARRTRAARGSQGVRPRDPAAVEIKTWDSSAQIRWFVVPERPAGTDGMSEADLAKLVTAEGMMGVARV